MGIFDIGDFIVLGAVAILILVTRRMDRQNRSLDNVRRFFEKTRADFDAYIKTNQERLYDLTSELSSYDKTSKEVLRRIEADAEEVRQQAENLNQVKEVMVELLSVRDNVMESLENLKDDAAYVSETSRRIEILGQKVQRVEASSDRLLAELADRNEKSLELQRQELQLTLEKERESIQQDLAKTVQASDALRDELNSILTQKEEVLVRNLKAYSSELERMEQIYTQRLQEMEAHAGDMQTEGLLKIKENMKYEFARIQEVAGQMFLQETLRFKEELENQVEEFGSFTNKYRQLEEAVVQKFDELSLKSHSIAEEYNQFDIRMHSLYSYIQTSFTDEAKVLKEDLDTRMRSLSQQFEAEHQQEFDLLKERLKDKVEIVGNMANAAEERAVEVQARIAQEQDRISVSLAEMQMSIEQEGREITHQLEEHRVSWQTSFAELTEHYGHWQNEVRESLLSEHEQVMQRFAEESSRLESQWQEMHERISDARTNMEEELSRETLGYQVALAGYSDDIEGKISTLKKYLDDSVSQGYSYISEGQESIHKKVSDEHERLQRELDTLTHEFEQAKDESRALVRVAQEEIFQEAKSRMDMDLESLSQKMEASLQQIQTQLNDENVQAQRLSEDIHQRYENLETKLRAKIEDTEGFYNSVLEELRQKQEVLLAGDDEWQIKLENMQEGLRQDTNKIVLEWKDLSTQAFHQAMADGRGRYGTALEKVAEELDERISHSVMRLENLETTFNQYQHRIEQKQEAQSEYVNDYVSRWQEEFEQEKQRIERETSTVFGNYNQEAQAVISSWQNNVSIWQEEASNLRSRLEGQIATVGQEVQVLDEQWKQHFASHEESWQARWQAWCLSQEQVMEGDRMRYQTIASDIRELSQQLEYNLSALKQDMQKKTEDFESDWQNSVQGMDQRWQDQLSGLEDRASSLEEDVRSKAERLQEGWDIAIEEIDGKWQSRLSSLEERSGVFEQEIRTKTDSMQEDWHTAIQNIDERWQTQLTELREKADLLTNNLQQRADEMREDLQRKTEDVEINWHRGIAEIDDQARDEMTRLREKVQEHVGLIDKLGENYQETVSLQFENLDREVQARISGIAYNIDEGQKKWQEIEYSLTDKIGAQQFHLDEVMENWRKNLEEHQEQSRNALDEESAALESRIERAKDELSETMMQLFEQGKGQIDQIGTDWQTEMARLEAQMGQHVLATRNLGDSCEAAMQHQVDHISDKVEQNIAEITAMLTRQQEVWKDTESMLGRQIDEQKDFVNQNLLTWQEKLNAFTLQNDAVIAREKEAISSSVQELKDDITIRLAQQKGELEERAMGLEQRWEEDLETLNQQVQNHVLATEKLGENYNQDVRRYFADLKQEAQGDLVEISQQIELHKQKWVQMEGDLQEKLADQKDFVETSVAKWQEQLKQDLQDKSLLISREYEVITERIEQIREELDVDMERLIEHGKQERVNMEQTWQQELSALEKEVEQHIATTQQVGREYQTAINQQFDEINLEAQKRILGIDQRLSNQEIQWQDMELGLNERAAEYKNEIQESLEKVRLEILGVVEQNQQALTGERQTFAQQVSELSLELRRTLDTASQQVHTEVLQTSQNWRAEIAQLSNEVANHVHELQGLGERYQVSINDKFDILDNQMKVHNEHLLQSLEKQNHDWNQSLSIWQQKVDNVETHIDGYADERKNDMAQHFDAWQDQLLQKLQEQDKYVNDMKSYWQQELEKFHGQMTGEIANAQEGILNKYDEFKLGMGSEFASYEDKIRGLSRLQADQLVAWEENLKALAQQFDTNLAEIRDYIAKQMAEDRQKWDQDFSENILVNNKNLEDLNRQIEELSQQVSAEMNTKLEEIRERQQVCVREWSGSHEELQDVYEQHLVQMKNQLDQIQGVIDEKVGLFTDELNRRFASIDQGVDENLAQVGVRSELIEAAWQQRYEQHTREFADRLDNRETEINETLDDWRERLDHLKVEVDGRLGEAIKLADEVSGRWKNGFEELQTVMEEKARASKQQLEHVEANWQEQIADVQRLITERLEGSRDWAENIEKEWHQRYEDTEKQLRERTGHVNILVQEIETAWEQRYQDFSSRFDEKSHQMDDLLLSHSQELKQKVRSWEDVYQAHQGQADKMADDLATAWQVRFEQLNTDILNREKQIEDAALRVEQHWQDKYQELKLDLDGNVNKAVAKIDQFINGLDTKEEEWQEVFGQKCQEIEQRNQTLLEKSEEQFAVSRDAYQAQMALVQQQVDEIRTHWKGNYDGLSDKLAEHIQLINKESQSIDENWQNELENLRKISVRKQEESKTLIDDLEQTWRRRFKNFNQGLESWLRGNDERVEQRLKELQDQWEERLDAVRKLEDQRQDDVQEYGEKLVQTWKSKTDELTEILNEYLKNSRGNIEEEIRDASLDWQESLDKVSREIEEKVQDVSLQTRSIEERWQKGLDELDQVVRIQNDQFNLRKDDMEGQLHEQMIQLEQLQQGILEKSQKEVENIEAIWQNSYKELNSQFASHVHAVDEYATEVEQGWRLRMSTLNDQIENYSHELQGRLEGLDQSKMLIDSRLKELEDSINQHFSMHQHNLEEQVSHRLNSLAEQTRADWEGRLGDVKKNFALRVSELENAAADLRENQTELEAEKAMFLGRLQTMLQEADSVFYEGRMWVERNTAELQSHLTENQKIWQTELNELTRRMDEQKGQLDEAQDHLMNRLANLEGNSVSQVERLKSAWDSFSQGLTQDKEILSKQLSSDMQQFAQTSDVIKQKFEEYQHELDNNWNKYLVQLEEKTHAADIAQQNVFSQSKEILERLLSSAEESIVSMKQNYEGRFENYEQDFQEKLEKFTHSQDAHLAQLEEKGRVADTVQENVFIRAQEALEKLLRSTEEKVLIMKQNYESRFENYDKDFEENFDRFTHNQNAHFNQLQELYDSSLEKAQQLSQDVEEYTKNQKNYMDEQEETFKDEWRSLLTNLTEQQQVFESHWHDQVSEWKEKEFDLSNVQERLVQENRERIQQIMEQMDQQLLEMKNDYESRFARQLEDNKTDLAQTTLSLGEDSQRVKDLYQNALQQVDQIAQVMEVQLKERQAEFDEKQKASFAQWYGFLDNIAQQKDELEKTWNDRLTSLDSKEIELSNVQKQLSLENENKINATLSEIGEKFSNIQSEYETRFHEQLRASYKNLNASREKQEGELEELESLHNKGLQELVKLNKDIQEQLSTNQHTFESQIDIRHREWETLLQDFAARQHTIEDAWNQQLSGWNQREQDFQRAQEELIGKNNAEMETLFGKLQDEITFVESSYKDWREKVQNVALDADKQLRASVEEIDSNLRSKEKEYLQSFEERRQQLFYNQDSEFEKEKQMLQKLFDEKRAYVESQLRDTETGLHKQRDEHFSRWNTELTEMDERYNMLVGRLEERQTSTISELKATTEELQSDIAHFLDTARVEIGESLNGANKILAQFDDVLKHKEQTYFEELEQNFTKITEYRQRLEEQLHKEKNVLQESFAARLVEVDMGWQQFNQQLSDKQNSFDEGILERMRLADAQLATLEERLSMKEDRFEENFSEKLAESMDKLRAMEGEFQQRQYQFEETLNSRLTEAGESLKQLEHSFEEKREQFGEMLSQKLSQASDQVDNIAISFESRYEAFEVDFDKRMDKAMADVHDLERELIQGSQSLIKDSEVRLSDVQTMLTQLVADLEIRQRETYTEIRERIENADGRIKDQMSSLGVDLGELEKDLTTRQETINEHFATQQRTIKSRFDEVQSQIDQKIHELLDQQRTLQDNVHQFKSEIDQHLDRHREEISRTFDAQMKQAEEEISQLIFNQTQETEQRLESLSHVVAEAERQVDQKLAEHHERFREHFVEIEQVVALAGQDLDRHKTEVEEGRQTLESRLMVLRDNTNKELGRSTEELKAYIASSMQQTSEDLSLEFMGQLEQRLNDYEDALKTKMERLESFIHDVDVMEGGLRDSMTETANRVRKDMGGFETEIRSQHERELERAASMLNRTQAAISELEVRVNDLRRQALDNVTGRLTEFEQGFLEEINRREEQLGQYIGEWQRNVEKSMEVFEKRKQQERDDVERKFEQESKAYFSRFEDQVGAEISKFNQRLEEFIEDVQTRSGKTQNEVSKLHEQLTNHMESFVYQANQQMDERLNTLRENTNYQISDTKTKAQSEFNAIAQQLEEERRSFSTLLNDYQNQLEKWREKNMSALEEREEDLIHHFDVFKKQVHAQFNEVNEQVVAEKEKMSQQLQDQIIQLGKHFSAEKDEIVGASESERRRLKDELEELANKAQVLSQGIERRSDLAVEGLQRLSDEAMTELQRRSRVIQQEMDERLRDARVEAQELRERTDNVREQTMQEIRSHSGKLIEQLQHIEKKQQEIEGNAAVFKKADEMRGDLENALVDLADRMERVERHRSDMVDLEAQLGRAFKVNDSLAEKLATLTRERQRFDTLDEKMGRAMQLSESVDNKLKEITEVSDTLQEIQVHLRDLSGMEKELEDKFERLTKKSVVADNTAKGIDNNFEKMRGIETEMQKTLTELQSMQSTLQTAQKDLENIGKQKPQIDHLMGFVSSVDNKLHEIESRIERIDEMRDWIVQAERRIQDVQQDVKSSMRSAGQKSDWERPDAPGNDDVDNTVIKLAQQGWTAEQIAQQLKLPVGQVSLIIDRWRSRK